MSNTFQPSSYSSYGANEPIMSSEDTGKTVAAYVPAIKSLLGIDDARARVAKLESRLRTLRAGGPTAQAVALSVCGLCSVATAVQRTEALRKEAQAQATQLKTRDFLYTALAVTGVVAGVALTGLIASKAWTQYQQGQIQQEELNKLRG